MAIILYARPIIRQLFAGVLLILFAFSITPRQVLHDEFANHKDTAAHRCDYGNVIHFSTDGFHCKCDNLVAESPFTHATIFFTFQQQQVFAGHPVFVLPCLHTATHFYFSLRGPPATSLA